MTCLKERLETHTAKVCVVGLGYVGLPMALAMSAVGFTVYGYDISRGRIEELSAGKSYISDVPNPELQKHLAAGTFVPTNNSSKIAECDVVVICVPTPLSKAKDPDLRAIISATETVTAQLRSQQLIVLESTTYPGTTEEVLLPKLSGKGLKVGKDFHLAFSPERIDPGNTEFNIRTITKVVGGVTPNCTEVAKLFYQQFVDTVVPVSNPRIAEASKLLENTFRSVNIGLANEMALICDRLDINVWEVIDAAATKPFGFMAHYPGPGIGGHCIPLDPHYLSWKARLSGYEPKFISLATEINGAMPHHVVDIVSRALNDESKSIRGSKILILGVAYKPNVSDFRESPSLEVIEMLLERGALISYSDPYVPEILLDKGTLVHRELNAHSLSESDCVLILTHHRDFDYTQVVNHSRLTVDTRNVTRNLVEQGNIHYL